MNSIDKFKRFGQNIYNGQDVLKNHILNKYPICYTNNTDDYEQVRSYQSDFVWLVDQSIKTLDTFPWWFRPTERNAIHQFPYMFKWGRKVKSWNKVKLVPTKTIPEKVVKQKNICGYYDAWQGKSSFDIFFLGNTKSKVYDEFIKKYPNTVTVSSYSQAQSLSSTDMFWLVPDDIDVHKSFNLNKYIPDEWSLDYTHVFGNDRLNEFDGIALFPKEYRPTEKELKYRFYVNKKEIKIPVSKRAKYDVFVINNYEDYLNALKNSTTEMFWTIYSDIIPSKDFKFDLTFKITNDYDRNQNHVFLHCVDEKLTYDGVFLLSKNVPVSKREIEFRHIVERKEWDIVASGPKPYDQFTIDSYEEYLSALESSTTELFWASSRNIEILDHFKFDLHFDYRGNDYVYDRNENHAFIHRVDGIDYYNGLFLFSKNKIVSKKEIEHRHLVSFKEWDIVASGPKPYDQFTINTYDEYLSALESSTTELFWASSRNIDTSDFDFNLYFTHNNEYDRKQNHAFIHQINNNTNYHGLFLLSKHKPISKKEIEHRFLVDFKKWDILASKSIKYDIFIIDNWDEYQFALNNTSTELFWMTSRNIDTSKFDFNLFFDDRDNEFEYERNTNHAFIHRVNGQDLYNGVFLMSSHVLVTQKEIEHRHIVDRKEWDIVASGPKKYDIFTVDSYDDYINALKNSTTEMFWAVSSNIDTSDFDFDVYFTHNNEYDRTTNHAFKHEVNNETLFNGVFLLTTNLTD